MDRKQQKCLNSIAANQKVVEDLTALERKHYLWTGRYDYGRQREIKKAYSIIVTRCNSLGISVSHQIDPTATHEQILMLTNNASILVNQWIKSQEGTE